MTVTDRRVLNETATVGSDVVVRVDLENVSPVRDRITLNLTANRTLVAQQSVTIGIDARRTVSLRTAFDRPGRYALGVNGVEVGTVTVTTAGTPTDTTTRTQSPGIATETAVSTPTEQSSPTERSYSSSPTSTGPTPESSSPGPDEPTGVEAVVALGMSLMLLYGVGIAVYVVRE